MLICEGGVLEVGRTISAKTMRQECAWCGFPEQSKAKNLTLCSFWFLVFFLPKGNKLQFILYHTNGII